MDKNNYSSWNLFRESCEKYSQNTMVIHDNMQLKYSQMYNMVQDFAQLLEKVEFRIGGIYLPNSAWFIACMLALSKLEKIVVPLAYQLKGQTLMGRLNYSDMELIVTDEKGFEELLCIKDRIDIHTVLVLESSGGFKTYSLNITERVPVNISKDIFAMFLIPRNEINHLGVMVSNRSIITNTFINANLAGLNCNDVILTTRSFAIADPIVGDLLTPIYCGACIVILSDLFHPAIILKAIQDYKITSVLMVGTMIKLLLDYPNLQRFDLKTLKRIEFASITTPQWIVEDMIKKLPGVELCCIYGVPEAPTRVSYLTYPDTLRFPGSIGSPPDGYEIKIYKDDGSEAECGEEGIIYIASNYLMEGYYKYPHITSSVKTSKGLRTNDIGYKDENGNLYLARRADEMIMQGGYEVYPIEIKEVLLGYPNIEEVEIFGIYDEKLGRKAIAIISIKSDVNTKVLDVIKWCRENIEDKKMPKEIHVIDKRVMQILKKRMR